MEPAGGAKRVDSMNPRHESEEDQLAALYSSNARSLVGLLIMVGAEPAMAEDLMQEAYARLLPRWRKVSHYEDPSAWVRTVALRLYVSARRRDRIALRHLASTKPASSAALSPDRVALEAALARLPVAQRIVVVMHHMLDMPVQTVAETLRIPSGTVKSRLSRGRAALAQYLDDEVSQ